MNRKFESLVREAVESSYTRVEDSGRDQGQFGSYFFRAWFRVIGKSYFFLFKRNFEVTNLQISELLALIDMQTQRRENNQWRVQFVPPSEFRQIVQSAYDSLPPKDDKYLPTELAIRLGSVIANIVCVEPLFGSCAIYLPPGMHLDLPRLCGESGYIHSCGQLLLFRNLSKVTHSDILANVSAFSGLLTNGERTGLLPLPTGQRTVSAASDSTSGVEVVNGDGLTASITDSLDESLSPTKSSPPVRFVAYSHEDFSPYDQDKRDDLNKGVGDLKIHLEKLFVRQQGKSIRLIESIKYVQNATRERIIIPEPGNYLKSSSEENLKEVDRDRSIFMILDRVVDGSTLRKGDQRFLVVYVQEFLNENPFHIMDENKPAWYAHTTIPHTLMGAMVNLGRSMLDRRDGASLLVADPFCGSGTTALEMSKFGSSAVGSFADNSVFACRTLQDNFEFFSLNSQELIAVLNQAELANIAKMSITNAEEALPVLSEYWRNFRGLSAQIAGIKVQGDLDRQEDSGEELGAIVEEVDFKEYESDPFESEPALKDLSLGSRIGFYTCLKAWKRHAATFERIRGYRNKRVGQLWINFLISEARLLRAQIEELVRLKLALEKTAYKTAYETTDDTALVQFKSRFSRGVTIGTKFVVVPKNAGHRDARELPRNSVDLIICDPPYGFNTDEDAFDLSELYVEVFRALIAAINPGGCLVVCLPDRSFLGRDFSAFARPLIVDRLVRSLAAHMNRRVSSIGDSAARLTGASSPVLYWRSDKVLQRSILLFRID